MNREKFAVGLAAMVLFASAGCLWPAEKGLIFHASFDKTLDADFVAAGDGKATAVRSSSVLPLTQEGQGAGNQGKGVVFARDNLKDFHDVMANPSEAIPGLSYSTEGVISPDEGTIEFWIKPYFNQTEPYGPKFHQDFKLCYILDARLGPGINTGLNSYIINNNCLTFSFDATGSDKSSTMTVNPLGWEPKTWHHVAFAWNKDVKILIVDGVKRAESRTPGSLIIGKTVSIGGTGQSCVLQGVLDDLRIYSRAVY